MFITLMVTCKHDSEPQYACWGPLLINVWILRYTAQSLQMTSGYFIKALLQFVVFSISHADLKSLLLSVLTHFQQFMEFGVVVND